MKSARRKVKPPKVTIHDTKEVAAFRRFLRLLEQKVDRINAYKTVYGSDPLREADQ